LIEHCRVNAERGERGGKVIYRAIKHAHKREDGEGRREITDRLIKQCTKS
jgi:hypothetical protein